VGSGGSAMLEMMSSPFERVQRRPFGFNELMNWRMHGIAERLKPWF
jgi:hypothetical protein